MYAPTSAIEGVACWYREDGPNPSFWRLIRVGGLVALLRERDAWSRLIALEPYLSQIRKTWMRGPYLFLDLLAIAPSLQGRGFGATLLRHFVGRGDANRLPCCVETFNRSNVPMYRHFGFEVAEEAQETPVGEALYFMTREPQLA
jgi:GNAT superfamily N-acetyltransferase